MTLQHTRNLHSQKNNNGKKDPKVFLYLLTKQLITNVTITTAIVYACTWCGITAQYEH